MTNELNSKLFNEVADWIEANPGGYNQNDFGIHPLEEFEGIVHGVELSCETPCCIASHLAALADPNREYREGEIPRTLLMDANFYNHPSLIQDIAQDATGLNWHQREALFSPRWPENWWVHQEKSLQLVSNARTYYPFHFITVKVLRRIAVYGFDTEFSSGDPLENKRIFASI